MANHNLRKILALTASALALALAGCGGGDDDPPTPVALGGSFTGLAFKGPIHGAAVCAYVIDNGASDRRGTLVPAQSGSMPVVVDGCVMTGRDGAYTLVLPDSVGGDLLLQTRDGTYCSNDSEFDSEICADGGVPVPMGINALRTVATAPGLGAMINAPLSLLTTAAVQRAGTLSAASFRNAYSSIATQFGLANTPPSANPSAGLLNTLLRSLTAHLGDDNSLIASLVDSIADGTLSGADGRLVPLETVRSWSLTPSERQYVMLESACFAYSDGTYHRHSYAMFLPDGRATTGTFSNDVYMDALCEQSIDQITSTYQVEYLGEANVVHQATTDVRRSQAGSATAARFTFPSDERLGDLSGLNANFMIARVTDACRSESRAYLSAIDSAAREGVLSRLDVSRDYRIYCEN